MRGPGPGGLAPLPVRLSLLVSVLALGATATPGWGYPELEAFIESHSGRYVDCAFCHTNPDGPEGVKPGQIRSLTPEELERLNRARAAFEPGSDVDSPILNDFGDEILRVVGKRRFLALRASDPEKLADALGFGSDLDGDGIPDAREYLDGTNPLDPQHGDPWRLALVNLRREGLDLAMIALATLLGLYGLDRLVRGLEAAASAEERGDGR